MKETIQNPNETIGFLRSHTNYATIYIGNLSYKKNASALKSLFQKYGKVSFVNLIKNPKTQKSMGYAFIQMTNLEFAHKAIKALNGTQLDGRTLKVSLAQDNHTYKFEENSTKKAKPLAPTRRKREKGLKILEKFLKEKK